MVRVREVRRLDDLGELVQDGLRLLRRDGQTHVPFGERRARVAFKLGVRQLVMEIRERVLQLLFRVQKELVHDGVAGRLGERHLDGRSLGDLARRYCVLLRLVVGLGLRGRLGCFVGLSLVVAFGFVIYRGLVVSLGLILGLSLVVGFGSVARFRLVRGRRIWIIGQGQHHAVGRCRSQLNVGLKARPDGRRFLVRRFFIGGFSALRRLLAGRLFGLVRRFGGLVRGGFFGVRLVGRGWFLRVGQWRERKRRYRLLFRLRRLGRNRGHLAHLDV